MEFQLFDAASYKLAYNKTQELGTLEVLLCKLFAKAVFYFDDTVVLENENKIGYCPRYLISTKNDFNFHNLNMQDHWNNLLLNTSSFFMKNIHIY